MAAGDDSFRFTDGVQNHGFAIIISISTLCEGVGEGGTEFILKFMSRKSFSNVMMFCACMQQNMVSGWWIHEPMPAADRGCCLKLPFQSYCWSGIQ